eukprot:1847872-Pleurochrysis_carterae.AAC.1
MPSSPGSFWRPCFPRQLHNVAALPRHARMPCTAARSRQHLMPRRTSLPSSSSCRRGQRYRASQSRPRGM